MKRRQFLGFSLAGLSVSSGSFLFADDPYSEPVHRVANAKASSSTPPVQHPLDQALDLAQRCLIGSQQNVQDYAAVLVKRERIDGTVKDHEFMNIKVRNRKVQDGRLVQPFSVYLGFIKPAAVAGRECLFVEGKNGGNLTAHEGGFKGRFLPTVNIPPTGMLAMRGQRYPITEIGLEKLMEKLLERGGRARKAPGVQCEFRKNARVRDRVCTVIQVVQPTPAPGNEFHTAQVFLDDEFNLPIRYVAYDYPKPGQSQGEIIEEYTYLNLKVNVGLTDLDFDSTNPKYKF